MGSGDHLAPAAGEPWAAVVETHTAALFFAGDKVVKVKKPVDLGFVDLTTPEARRVVCEAEVSLNRRLSPDVYLGLATVQLDGCAESAVVMRRLPAAAELTARVLAGAPDLDAGIRDVGRLLAEFHSRCPVVGRDLPLSTWTPTPQLWRREIQRIRAMSSELIDRRVLDDAARLSMAYAAGRGGLLRRRLEDGLVRDGHGDLLAADVFLLPDGPRLLDCLEFDERLRTGDVLLDVAFLAMDLERLGRPDLAQVLLASYAGASGETHPRTLADYYIAYRALVRAKVVAIRAAQPAASDDTGEDPRRLMQLCLAHLRSAQVRLILLGGLPGAGKTALARRLAEDTGALHLSSDAVRAELFPAAEEPSSFGHGRYAAAATGAVYEELLRRAREAVEAGIPVVIDASWSTGAHRRAARHVASEGHAVLVEVQVRADERVAHARLAHRVRVPGGSEADPEVRRRMQERFDPWPEATVLDNNGLIDEASARLVELVAG